MEGKKSFLIFKDTLSIADDLDDEQLGKLFRAIINYQLGRPNEMDFVTKIAFNTFKSQFDRDNEKWEQKAEANRINGKKGGRPKKPKETQDNPKNPDGFLKTQHNPQKPVTVTVTDTVTVKGTVTDKVTDTGSDTRSKDIAPKARVSKPKKSKSYDWPKPEGVEQQHWDDWIQHRKAKRLPLSKTVMDKIEREADKANLTLGEVIKKCAEKPWAGFESSWLASEQRGSANTHDLSDINYNVVCPF